MAPSALFEDFSEIETPRPIVEENPSPEINLASENQNRQSFDDGYKEGWVDAQSAAKGEQDKLSADVATALQEASFTYYEARQHVFNSMRPLLEAMIKQFIPTLAKENIVPIIVEHIEALAQKTEPPLCILCAPEIVQELTETVQAAVSFPVEVKPEQNLTPTQALLQFSDGEARVDLGEVQREIETAIENFYDLTNDKEAANV